MSKVILFQGDSITDAERSRNNDDNPGIGYPLLVKADLSVKCPQEYTFYNRGCAGFRVVDLYARIKADIINLKPDHMSILIGVNDVWHELLRQNGVAAPKFERVYDMLLTEIKEELPDCQIILLEPFVLKGSSTCKETEPERWEFFSREVPLRAEATRRVAEKHGLIFVPLQSVFEAACKVADSTYWLMDGVHPTTAGHELIAREWLKAFENA